MDVGPPDAGARVDERVVAEPREPGSRPGRAFAPEASVVVLRPRRLRGTIGILKRPLPDGWEVEIRSAEGTPLHLTLPERALFLR